MASTDKTLVTDDPELAPFCYYHICLEIARLKAAIASAESQNSKRYWEVEKHKWEMLLTQQAVHIADKDYLQRVRNKAEENATMYT